jgi:catechol 2,3-dioxygenase-like lactoylglutathione lyase family enzyme
MADLEVGGLHRASSISRTPRRKRGTSLGLRLGYRSVNFDDRPMYHLANGASGRDREEGPTQEELAPVRQLGRRVAEKGGLLVGGRAHV